MPRGPVLESCRCGIDVPIDISILIRRFFLMPRKIRQLITDLEQAGFLLVQGGKGAHRKFRHPRFAGAHHYQEKQVHHAISEVTQ